MACDKLKAHLFSSPMLGNNKIYSCLLKKKIIISKTVQLLGIELLSFVASCPAWAGGQFSLQVIYMLSSHRQGQTTHLLAFLLLFTGLVMASATFWWGRHNQVALLNSERRDRRVNTTISMGQRQEDPWSKSGPSKCQFQELFLQIWDVIRNVI